MDKYALMLVCCLAATLPATVSAQTIDELAPEQRELLGRLFTEARTAYDANDYATSIARLEEAWAIFPEPNILYRIAEMHEQLGERDAAIGRYGEYLTNRPDAPNAVVVKTRIKRLRAERDAARPKTARLTIDSLPQGATVYINDVERQGVTPLEIEVKPGKYAISLVRSDYEPSVRTVEVDAGDLRTFDFRLTKTKADVIVVEEPSVAPWVLLGVGASTALASGVLFLVANDRQDTIDAYESTKRTSTRPSDYDQVLDQRETYQKLGIATAGLAAACVVVGGMWWLLDDDESTSVGLTPSGATFRARF
ncbi:MAG: PEGA domain-containing protein [bacterium]